MQRTTAAHRRHDDDRDQSNAYHAVVSNLVSLAEHVQKCLSDRTDDRGGNAARRFGEFHQCDRVLDDASPRYAKGAAAVRACDVNPRHCPAFPAGRRRWRSLRGGPAGAVAHRRVGPTRRGLLGAYDRKRDPQAVESVVYLGAGSAGAIGLQCTGSSAFEPPDFFLPCLPRKKRMSISVPLTRTSSQRR